MYGVSVDEIAEQFEISGAAMRKTIPSVEKRPGKALKGKD
jgi:hypothetical protein